MINILLESTLEAAAHNTAHNTACDLLMIPSDMRKHQLFLLRRFSAFDEARSVNEECKSFYEMVRSSLYKMRGSAQITSRQG